MDYEVRQRPRRSGAFRVALAALAASGCVSGATSQVRREASVAIDRAAAPRRTAIAAEGGEDVPARDCDALAAAVALGHPSAVAARERASAALARSRAEGALPPPEAYLEVWDLPLGQRDPVHGGTKGMYMGGLVQELPAARARDRRARAEAEDALAALAEGDEVVRAIHREVAHACVDWSAAAVVHGELARHRAVLVETLEAALAAQATGGASLGRVARAEAELAALERRMIEAEAEADVARAAVEALAADLAVVPEEAPPLPRDDAAVTADPTAQATATRGDVRAAAARARGAAARADAAAVEARAPSFALRATYMQMPGETPGLGAMVSMSLPWLARGGAARRDAAEAAVAASRAESDAAERAVRAEVARAAARVVALRRALEVLTTREIPAAERAIEAERAGLAAGAFDLAAWVDSAHALAEARVEAARLAAALAHARVDLDASASGPSIVAGGEVSP